MDEEQTQKKTQNDRSQQLKPQNATLDFFSIFQQLGYNFGIKRCVRSH